MTKRMPVIVSGLMFVICGSVLSQTAEENMTGKPAISKGMSLTEAIRVFRKNGVHYEEIVTPIRSENPNEQLREFVIRPLFKSPDAVKVIVAARVNSDDYSIRRINWHLNWEQDAMYPYSLRGNKILYLEKLDLDVLKELPQEVIDKRASFKRDRTDQFDF